MGGCVGLFDRLAEDRIQAALARGELSGLPGEGQALVLDDDCLVPPEVRMANRVLRNAGHVPPALRDLAELRRLTDPAACAGECDLSPRERALRIARLMARIEAAGLARVAAPLLFRRLLSDAS